MFTFSDLQFVNITLRILHRPEPSKLPSIYMNIGFDYAERVLPSITNEVLKAVVAQFDAGELITQRETVSQRIETSLSERAAQFGIILDDISITHLSFSPEFTAAVEQKQVAQQEAELAKYRVEMAEQIKKAAITQAEGDAIAAKMINQSMQRTSLRLRGLNWRFEIKLVKNCFLDWNCLKSSFAAEISLKLSF